MTDGAGQRCYRHPDRDAYISCQRCGRPICPECMRDAAVGFQCPSCVKEGASTVRQPRTAAGGRISAYTGRATFVLIGLNVAIYLAQLATGDRTSELFQQGAMLATSGTTPDGTTLTGVADGGYWRLLTSAFLHNDVLHLASNMLGLFLFGPVVERALGTWRFVVAYLVMAWCGSTAVYVLTDVGVLTVGASGAVLGLLAMAFVLLLRSGQDVTTLVVLIVLNAVLSLRENISWQGHLGGFVAGLVLASAVAYAPPKYRQVAQIGAVVGLLALSVVLIVVRTTELT